MSVGGDDVCEEVADWLRLHLQRYVPADSKMPKIMTQLPAADAMQSAAFPAVAIVSPGLTEPPTKTRNGYSATWRVVVTVWVRGAKHDQTQSLTRRYVLGLRRCLTAWPRGTWVDEGYAEVDDVSAARTVGAGFVELNVFVPDAVTADDLEPDGDLPTVQQTFQTLTSKE